MRRIWKRHSPIFAVCLFGAGFLAGLVCAPWSPADAQQRFGKDDVESVPKSFLEGGDRSYTELKTIAASTKAAAESLSNMEKGVAGEEQRHGELMKKLDALDARMQQMHAALEEAI